MGVRFIPIVVGMIAAGSVAEAGSVGPGRGYDPETIAGLTAFGEAGYRYSGDAPSSGKIRIGTDLFSGKYGFGLTSAGQVQFFDSDRWNSSKGHMTVWEGDVHGYYQFPQMFTVGAYYAYEGSNDVYDFQYYGGEGMFSMSGFTADAKVGVADKTSGKGHGTAYEIAGYYDIADSWSFGAGYGRIDSNRFGDFQRAFGRVSYAGLIPNNGLGMYVEVSYFKHKQGRYLNEKRDDTSIGAGVEYQFGRSADVGRRMFRKPISYWEF